jgi:hypothetical protein
MGPEGQVQDQTYSLSLESMAHRTHILLDAGSEPDGGGTTKSKRKRKITVK